MRHMLLVLAALGAVCSPNLKAGLITIDFEGVPDSTPVATRYTGQRVTFSSDIIAVLGAFGGILDELDFPPVPPGQAVFLNEADTTSLLFSQPILSFCGYFTCGGPLTLNFYAAGNTLLGLKLLRRHVVDILPL